MRYRLMASYLGAPYQAAVGPSDRDVTLFAAPPPPEEHGFSPAPGGTWRKQVRLNDIDALWESRPIGSYRGEPCLVLDDLGDRLHIVYLGMDSRRAAQLGYWQVDRGVFEVVVSRQEVTDLAEERHEFPLALLLSTLSRSVPAAPQALGLPPAGGPQQPAGPNPPRPQPGPGTGPQPLAAQQPPMAGPQQPPGVPQHMPAAHQLSPGQQVPPSPQQVPPSQQQAPPSQQQMPIPAWQQPAATRQQPPAPQPQPSPQAMNLQPPPALPAPVPQAPVPQAPAQPVAQQPMAPQAFAQQQGPPPQQQQQQGPPQQQQQGPQQPPGQQPQPLAPSAAQPPVPQPPAIAAWHGSPAVDNNAWYGYQPPPGNGTPLNGAAGGDNGNGQLNGYYANGLPNGNGQAAATDGAAPGQFVPAPAFQPVQSWPAEPATAEPATADLVTANLTTAPNPVSPPAPASQLAPPSAAPMSTAAPAAQPPVVAKPGGAVRGRRAARKPRLAMSAVFADLVDMADIPRSAYAVDEEVTGAMCLFKTDGGYEVFSCAEDARHEVRFFEDEEAAYFYLFGVLAAEALRNGRLSANRK